jgi:formylglycine-generating enzyme required for sulfatase activity
MVRFLGGPIRPGVFAAASRPPVCASLAAADDAAVLDHPEEVAEIRVEPFDLDVREVTNHEFARWLNEHAGVWSVMSRGVLQARQAPMLPLALTSKECGGGLTLSADGRAVVGAEQASWPVVCVTWYGASEYCRARGKRLPLETEWELAAKGRNGRPFPWGPEMPGRDGVTFDLRDAATAHPRDVGTSRQDVSPEGVHDLGGGVAEWVEDNRGLQDVKTIRGGSWASRGPCQLLGSGRKHIPPGRFAKDVGFRCASSVIDEASTRRAAR